MSKVFYTVKKILNEQYSIQLNQIQPEAKFELELGVDSREFFELITDFEKAFIKAEVVSYDDLIETGSMQAAREAGKLRLEGKEYIFADGDVTLFKCNA